MLSLKTIKRIMIALVGGTVLLIGIALIILPGPAFIVIPAGLAILAVEFAWARRWLHKTKEWIEAAKTRVRKKKTGEDVDRRTPDFANSHESER